MYLVGLLLASSSLLRAADYLGADAVLKKISEKPQAAATQEKPSDAVQLKLDIESFKKQSASLQANDAAQQWLKLLDRQFSLSPAEMQPRYGSAPSPDQLNPRDIWNALPAPAAWNALRAAIEARPRQNGTNTIRDLALQLIAHTLVADRKAQTNDLAQLEARAVSGGDENIMLVEVAKANSAKSLLEVSQAILTRS